MSIKTVTFRLTDEDLATLDNMVKMGGVPDRTAALRQSLARERRRLEAEHDAEIYARLGSDPDLDAIAVWAGAQDLDLD
jgi:Arc/MetJ-type ribon-helix-helix transcriptional regulator